MPEFRKIMEERPSVKVEEKKPESIYKDVISVVKEIYNQLGKEELPPPLVGVPMNLIKEIISMLKTSPAEMLKLAHTMTHEVDYIPQHAVNVSIISLHIGIILSLPDSELENLGIASLFHCVGRPFSREKELSFKDEHLKTKNGYINSIAEKLIQVEEVNDRVKEIIKKHHGAMGPNLYPFELPEETNIAERILIVADCYCTLLHHPIFKNGYYPHTALMWIVDHDGKPFEGEIIKALVNTVGLYPIGTWLELSTGEICQVIKSKPTFPMRPVVKVFLDSGGEQLSEPKIIDLAKDRIIHIKKVINESKIPQL